MQYRQVELSSNLFSMGNVLGTTGTQELIGCINQQAGFGNSYFGGDNDPFKDQYRHFMASVIQPIRESQEQLIAAEAVVRRADEFRPILSEQDIKDGIPPCMYQGILTFAPIRELARDGRIEAFGIDTEIYPEEDEYGRLINNGKVELKPENIVDGAVRLDWHWISTDPKATEDQLDILEMTREYLQDFITQDETCHLDPTSIPPLNLRG